MNTEINFLRFFLLIKRFYIDLYVYNFCHISNVFKWNIAIRRAVGFWFLYSKLLVALYIVCFWEINIYAMVVFYIIFQWVDFYLYDKVSRENVEMLYRTLKNKTPLRIISILILVLSIYSLCTVV